MDTHPPAHGADPCGAVVPLLADLVRRPSVNPMGREVAGPEFLERRVGDYLAQRFTAAGIAWARQTVAPGRDNVVARLDGTVNQAPAILWDAHQDTVPADGMTIDPFAPVVRDGRLYGRGACDVKGGMAAMVAALEQLSVDPRPRRFTVFFSATVNEEFGFSGARAIARLWDRPEHSDSAAAALLATRPVAAIVAEPTELALVTTHKGSVRWRMRVRGRSCHSSFPERGENAIYRAAPAILAIERLADELRDRFPGHPCGPPTINLGTIRGGAGVNLVPDQVLLELERRLVPGEDPAAARDEVIGRIAARCPPHWIEHDQPFLASDGLPDQADLPVIAGVSPAQHLADALRECGIEPRRTAARYGTNASVFARAAIPSVVFGPGSIDQAHTADEWVCLGQVTKAVAVLVESIAGPPPAS